MKCLRYPIPSVCIRGVLAGLLVLLVGLVACTSQRLSPQRNTVSQTDSTAVSDSTASHGAVSKAISDTLTPAFSYEERQGKGLFLHYCAVCHGEGGAGDGFNAYNLNPKPRDFTEPGFMRAVSNEHLTEIITQGGRGVNKSPLMPAWGQTLTKGDIEHTVIFLRTFATQNVNSRTGSK